MRFPGKVAIRAYACKTGDSGGLVDNSWVNILWTKVNWMQEATGMTPWYLAPATPAPTASPPPAAAAVSIRMCAHACTQSTACNMPPTLALGWFVHSLFPSWLSCTVLLHWLISMPWFKLCTCQQQAVITEEHLQDLISRMAGQGTDIGHVSSSDTAAHTAGSADNFTSYALLLFVVCMQTYVPLRG